MAFLVVLALGSVPLQKAVTLKLAPKVGTTYIYSSTTETKGGPQAMKSTSSVAMKVLQSDSKLVKLRSSSSNFKGSMPGAKEYEDMKYVMSMTPTYKVLDVKVEGANATNAVMANALKASMKMAPQFPTTPVKVGDNWTMVIDFKEMIGAVAKIEGDSIINFKMTLTKIETKAGKTLATLRLAGADTLKLSAGNVKLTVDFSLTGENVIDVANGMNVSSTSTTKQTMKGAGGGGTMTTSTSMKLVKIQ